MGLLAHRSVQPLQRGCPVTSRANPGGSLWYKQLSSTDGHPGGCSQAPVGPERVTSPSVGAHSPPPCTLSLLQVVWVSPLSHAVVLKSLESIGPVTADSSWARWIAELHSEKGILISSLLKIHLIMSERVFGANVLCHSRF